MRVKDELKKEAIYRASLTLIRQIGIAGLTMSKIAINAKIATGTLYIYFKNKEELINELYLKLETESSERFLADFDTELPYIKGLRVVWINYLKHRIEHHEESVFLEQYYHSPYITKQQRQIADNMKKPVLEILERGKTDLLINDTADTEMIFSAIIGFIRELAYEHIEGNYLLNEERINKAFLLNWNMIKT